ncbi:type VI secretion system baseplate subunit TssF [Flavobacterium oreochromis]|uniref:Type VI secretion system baseplate subunit TssF n=1 Tax=Flavobacterium columnare TaxID=996 RepID=A0A246GDF7_9FLAO|nr:type VI secretion system baseplate subunit TssF [Flavobacterium oreochromis]OWP79313.1 hypothetical protein BWK62_03190 [Flavobacterium oreochromis]
MNQERIKDRILRKASRLWGFNELQTESSFDPIVGLLLTACASELEKLNTDLEDSRSRIIERVLDLMFPEEVSGVTPSSAIVQVFPTENNIKISKYNRFKGSKKITNIYNPTEILHKDVFFGPTIETTLTTAKVEYLAYGNSLKKIDNLFFNDIISTADNFIPKGELWIGLKCSDTENIINPTFYVNINNSYQKDFFFYYLRQAKIYFGNQEFTFNEGYNATEESFNFENIVRKNYSNLDQINNRINNFYLPNFFTLNGTINQVEKTGSDTLFQQYFVNHQLENDKSIIWLRVELTETIGNDVLENVSITLNCLPVVNKRISKASHRVTGALNIIPIDSDEFFLDLDHVSNDEGYRYDLKNYDDTKSGTITLRRGGVSRFDQRRASDLLQQLLELIKDETASFMSIGNDATKETLKQINQNVAALYQLSKEKHFERPNNPYLTVNASSKDETGFFCNIAYWTTLGDEANDIKIGSVLSLEEAGTMLLEKNIMLITPTVGGRKGLSTKDKILEYRNSLLTRGRIVTIADIKAYGLNHFKNTITKIEIKKGTKKESSTKEGFARTIDIYLYRNTEVTEILKESEWEYLCDSFLINLKKASSNVYPYTLNTL